jgi:hypothetical protein
MRWRDLSGNSHVLYTNDLWKLTAKAVKLWTQTRYICNCYTLSYQDNVTLGIYYFNISYFSIAFWILQVAAFHEITLTNIVHVFFVSVDRPTVPKPSITLISFYFVLLTTACYVTGVVGFLCGAQHCRALWLTRKQSNRLSLLRNSMRCITSCSCREVHYQHK